MNNIERSVTIAKSRLSKRMAANNDASANEEEVDEQIEGDNVQKEARENGTLAPAPIMRSNKQIKTSDGAAAAGEEAEERAEKTRIDMPRPIPAQEDIRHLAYEIFERRGREFGQDKQDWLRAEKELTLVGTRLS